MRQTLRLLHKSHGCHTCLYLLSLKGLNDLKVFKVVSDCIVCLVPAFLTDFAEIGYIRFQFYITAICRQRTQQRLNIPPFARKQTELNNPRYLSTFINVFVTHFTRYAVDATSYSNHHFVLFFIISYFNMCCILFVFYIKPQRRALLLSIIPDLCGLVAEKNQNLLSEEVG